jgi:hypothetical protein
MYRYIFVSFSYMKSLTNGASLWRLISSLNQVNNCKINFDEICHQKCSYSLPGLPPPQKKEVTDDCDFVRMTYFDLIFIF